MTPSITILGAGAWGTALAIKLAARFDVALWSRDPAQALVMRVLRFNERYLPGFQIPDSVRVLSGFDDALVGAQCLIVATSTSALMPLVRALPSHDVPLLWLCKGFVFDGDEVLLPHQAVSRERAQCWGLLSGPSFAQEVAASLPGALTLAGSTMAFAEEWSAALRDDTFRLYATDDATGVEVGGAVKNVLAIATGICDGLRLGDNARAALITRGLAEMSRLAEALGGRRETLMGLSGLGDLVLTCTGGLSRNRQVGLQLATGSALPQIQHDLHHVAEGVYAAKAVMQLARREHIEMPISTGVYRVLYEGLSPRAAVDALLGRSPTRE